METKSLPVVEGQEWNRDVFNQNVAHAAVGVASYPDWLQTLVNKHHLHPVVSSMLIHQPLDWKALLRQWPHVSKADPQRLAYTPSDKYGQEDRQLVTSIGKYLAKHWPHIADHVKRDALALYTPDRLYFVHTIPEFVHAVDNGPRSCMQTGSGYCRHGFTREMAEQARGWMKDKTQPEPDWQLHPYACYAPEHGWHMALRASPEGRIDGRAMCLVYSGAKYFVRSYARPVNTSDNSETDQTLHAWLIASGYIFAKAWPDGANLHMPYIYGGYRAPYIDDRTSEGISRVSHCHDDIWEMDSDNGSHECDRTDGTMRERDEYDEDNDNESFCNQCDEYRDNDGFSVVGRDGDDEVCDHCIRRNYTLVRAQSRGRNNFRGYAEYYIPDDDAVWVGGTAYDEDNLPDNIVRLFNDDYAEIDDTVSVNGEYYLDNDILIVHLSGGECPRTGDSYALRDDTWTCARTGLIYSNYVENAEVDGETYHPDNVPEIEDLTEKAS